MAETWEALRFDEQSVLIKNMEKKDLAKKFKKDVSFFEDFKKFLDSMSAQTVPPKAKLHSPPKDLVISARRDLSFYEANFELIDNSIDAWRRNGAKKDLHIDITYDVVLLTGKFADDAGGLDEKDAYKVFIPGETTNRNFDQHVIGSFGMGAKKGIFRLTDGAKIITCKDPKFSATSQVPEKWEESQTWETNDGRAKATVVGRTELFFFKLFDPPTNDQIGELIKRCSLHYRPLLAKEIVNKRVVLTINGTEVEPARGPIWSGAKGAIPKEFVFSHTFKNFLSTGHDIPLKFSFTCGLTQKSAGKDSTERDEDWGIDVYGNGRLIERFRKQEFGFGTTGLGMRTSAMNYFRGELFIEGHSFAIPWDTHKREYLEDHPVSEFLRQRIRPIIKAYAQVANAFGSTKHKEIRNDYLEKKQFEGKPKSIEVSGSAAFPQGDLPKWGYEKEAKEIDKKVVDDDDDEKDNDEDEDEDEDNGSSAKIVESDDDEVVVSATMTRAEVEALCERFDVEDEDELSTALEECLRRGVAFGLTAAQFKKAKSSLECADANELSDTLKQSLVSKLGK